MAFYKVFYLGLNGAIFAAEDVECVDDDDAVERARERCSDHFEANGFEVWQRDRRVHLEKLSTL